MATATTVVMSPLQQQFKRARDVSAPLVAVRTADPSATIAQLARVTLLAEQKPAPIVQWDRVRGFRAISPDGKAATPASQEMEKQLGGGKILNPVEALVMAGKTLSTGVAAVPPGGAIFMMNVHDDYNSADFRQALWNLRDVFKRDFRTLVGTQPSGGVPSALEHDILVIDEPLPGPADLEQIVVRVFESTKQLTVPPKDVLAKAVEAVAGLSAFAAEQAVALSLSRQGLNLAALRDRHRQMIENTKGLSVWSGGDTFDGLGGLANFKRFATRLIGGRYRIGSVVWIDEIEKAMAGVRGDLTGISQDYLSVLLGYMQDHNVPGVLLMGHPGTGKSALAKAMGTTAGVQTVRMDLGAMHGSLVGESQHAIRHALKVCTAISQGRPLFVATCNSVAILPPELVNRFKWRFFVDLPDAEEKATIWPIHRRRYEVDAKDQLPEDADWNGREIEQCCATAYAMRCSLREAAETVVPIAQSSAEAIERRRTEAAGRYLSASRPGPYNHEARGEVLLAGGRRINLGDPETWPSASKGN